MRWWDEPLHNETSEPSTKKLPCTDVHAIMCHMFSACAISVVDQQQAVYYTCVRSPTRAAQLRCRCCIDLFVFIDPRRRAALWSMSVSGGCCRPVGVIIVDGIVTRGRTADGRIVLLVLNACWPYLQYRPGRNVCSVLTVKRITAQKALYTSAVVPWNTDV